MSQRSFLLTVFVVLTTTLLQIAESHTLNVMAVWFKRPYKGPQCVVEVVGADLSEISNKRFDLFSKPDIIVKCSHGKWDRKTQIEGNTFKPRFLWQAKMPFKKEKGSGFTVFDANVLQGDQVIGRAYIGAAKARELIKNNASTMLNVGDGIGVLKVKISKPPKNLDNKQGPFGLKFKPLVDDDVDADVDDKTSTNFESMLKAQILKSKNYVSTGLKHFAILFKKYTARNLLTPISNLHHNGHEEGPKNSNREVL